MAGATFDQPHVGPKPGRSKLGVDGVWDVRLRLCSRSRRSSPDPSAGSPRDREHRHRRGNRGKTNEKSLKTPRAQGSLLRAQIRRVEFRAGGSPGTGPKLCSGGASKRQNIGMYFCVCLHRHRREFVRACLLPRPSSDESQYWLKRRKNTQHRKEAWRRLFQHALTSRHSSCVSCAGEDAVNERRVNHIDPCAVQGRPNMWNLVHNCCTPAARNSPTLPAAFPCLRFGAAAPSVGFSFTTSPARTRDMVRFAKTAESILSLWWCACKAM